MARTEPLIGLGDGHARDVGLGPDVRDIEPGVADTMPPEPPDTSSPDTSSPDTSSPDTSSPDTSSPDELFSAMTLSLTPGTLELDEHETKTIPPRAPQDPARRSDPDDRSGDVIHGRYQLLRQLGKGGMGTVYIARHTTLPKTFAVKLLNARYAKRIDIAERFLQEARAVSLIEHDNVVGVIDFGRDDDGTAFLVMEHLRGESLAAVIQREGPLPWPRVRHIMLQLCRALQCAHAAGVVHRDVKPENVLRVDRPDDPDFIKVLDFGLAKLQVSGGVRLTATGMVLGTPDYMSPEQARGLPSDHRTDIYAAGVMMYELLCKRVPFSAKTFAAMRQKHLLEPPQPPSTWQSGIGEEIDAVVLRALAKDPAHRFASMAELGAAIEAVGSGKMVELIERTTLPLEIGTVLEERSVISTRSDSPGSEGGRSDEVPVRQRSRGWVIGLSCVGVVVAGVAIAFAAGVVGGAKTDPPTVAEASPAPAPAPEPAPRDTLLQFETNVPVVVEDAAGRTPFGDEPTRAITLPRSDVPMRLVLRADGYRDLHVVVTPNQDQIFAAQLEPLPQPPDAAPPPQQPEPPPPEQPTTRDRVRTKKAEPPPPPPEPEPEPEPTHSFSPEIRDPFGKDK